MKMNKNKPDPIALDDFENIIACGKVGKFLYPFNNLWFSLKTKLLENFAIFDGYDLQEWEDEDWRDEGEIYAWHSHVLKRYIFPQIPEHIFHIPTNEYSYDLNYCFCEPKRSENYFELASQAKDKFNGKKKYELDGVAKERAWKSLKLLVGKYGYLLKE